MRRTKITAFIALTALSAFLIVLSFTSPAGGETDPAPGALVISQPSGEPNLAQPSGEPNLAQPNTFSESVRAEALRVLASDAFDEMSSAGQMRTERMAGARKIKGIIVPYEASSFNVPVLPVPYEGATSPDTSSFVDPLVNNPAADSTNQNTQSETTIVLGSGTNVVSVFNDSGSNVGGVNRFTGYSTSANSGTAWTDRGNLPPSAAGDAGDPVMARNTTTGTILLATLAFSSPANLDIWRSTDNGITFAGPVNAATGLGSGNEDKEWIAIDNFAGTGNGNAYLFWRNFGTPSGMTLTRSTDGGVTWGPSGGTLIAGANGHGAQVAVSADHSVYGEWQLGTSPVGSIVIRRSTDLGVTFGATNTVTTIASTG